MAFKHPHRYGLMATVRKKDYLFLKMYKDKLDSNIKFYMKEDFFDDIAPQHISVCYFSYPDKYPEEYVEKLVPKINEIIKKYLPLKVKVKGLLGGWEVGIGVPAILWNITDFKEIEKMHKEIIETLKEDIEHFKDPEMDFTPHIGIALGNEEKLEELKKIIEDSKEDPEFELTIDNLFIFYPNGPKKIFDANSSE